MTHINREGIRLFGEKQARKYAEELGDIFRSIAQFPEASPRRDYLKRRARIRMHKAHVIIYTIDEDGVRILRIRHGREDWQDD